jgi:hypothetical protein
MLNRKTSSKRSDGTMNDGALRPGFGKYSALQFAAISLSMAMAMPAYASAPDIKPGLWEITMTVTASGVIMPDLDKLPPEKQEQVRKDQMQMQAQPRTIKLKQCLTEEKISKMDFSTRRNSPECTQDVKQDGSANWTVTQHCSSNGQTEDSVLQLQVLDSTHTLTSGQLTITKGTQVHKSELKQTSDWVSADCAGRK